MNELVNYAREVLARRSAEEGQRRLESAKDAVSDIEDPIQIGMIVEWDSRLFYGVCAATVLEVTAQHVRVIHPLTEQEALIPQSWLTVREP